MNDSQLGYKPRPLVARSTPLHAEGAKFTSFTGCSAGVGLSPKKLCLSARWRKSCSKAIHAFERFPTPAVARGCQLRPREPKIKRPVGASPAGISSRFCFRKTSEIPLLGGRATGNRVRRAQAARPRVPAAGLQCYALPKSSGSQKMPRVLAVARGTVGVNTAKTNTAQSFPKKINLANRSGQEDGL